MKWMTSEKLLSINHAGEWGAIHFYSAQMKAGKLRFPEAISSIKKILEHEKIHFDLFDQVLKNRKSRKCRALWFWKFGGLYLGYFTGLLGVKAAMVATVEFEDVVIKHFDKQLAWLKQNDQELYDIVSYIYDDEKAHEALAIPYAEGAGIIYEPLKVFVRTLTEIMMLLGKIID